MKLFSILSLATVALSQYSYDEERGKGVDKGPRWCGGKNNQVGG